MTKRKQPEQPQSENHNDRRSPDPWREGVDSDLHFMRKGHIDLNKKQDVTLGLILENTKITKEMGEKLDASVQKLDILVEDTEMIVRATRAMKQGGKNVGIISRFGERTASKLIKLGGLGLVLLGLWHLGTAVWHGTGLGTAWTDFMRFITK